MSKGGRRRRGSGGHPAKVAQRRQREQARQSPSETPKRLARQIARVAAGLLSAADAEVWASELLGTLGARRGELPRDDFDDADEVDLALLYGEPLLAELVRMEDPGAAIAIAAIADLDDGELGLQAKEMLDRHSLWRKLPEWVGEIGGSEIVGAAVMRDPIFEDGRTVFLETRFSDGQTMAVGVFIDTNLGGIARDVLLTESLDEIRQSIRAEDDADPIDELVLEALDPGVVAGLMMNAIELTDIAWDPPVTDEYWAGRALALMRAHGTPGVVLAEDSPEMAPAERAALRDAFLASDEASGFGADGDEAQIAALAIEFGADYMDGDPLRWSPTVVELFMVDWLPSDVMTTDAMLAALPRALAAWVTFAGHRRGLPDTAVARTLEAIAEFTEEMLEAAADPATAGPAKQLRLAVAEAGIDLDDHVALRAFLAGWNARDALDRGDGDRLFD